MNFPVLEEEAICCICCWTWHYRWANAPLTNDIPVALRANKISWNGSGLLEFEIVHFFTLHLDIKMPFFNDSFFPGFQHFYLPYSFSPVFCAALPLIRALMRFMSEVS